MFDDCVAYFGQWVDGKLAERKKNGKPRHKLHRLLGIKPKGQTIPKRVFDATFGLTDGKRVSV